MKKYQELEQKIKELQEEVERLKEEEIKKLKKLPKDFDIQYTLDVLEDPSKYYYKLMNSFRWSDTKQGVDYWVKIQAGSEVITPEDIIQLQKWCILYYQKTLEEKSS
jgi:predicted nuclease with TOPRIM domain